MGEWASENIRAGELTLPPADDDMGLPSWHSAGKIPLVVQRKESPAAMQAQMQGSELTLPKICKICT